MFYIRNINIRFIFEYLLDAKLLLVTKQNKNIHNIYIITKLQDLWNNCSWLSRWKSTTKPVCQKQRYEYPKSTLAWKIVFSKSSLKLGTFYMVSSQCFIVVRQNRSPI